MFAVALGLVVIGGQPVKFQLVSVDDQGDPKVGVNVAQKLVDGGVAAVIGHYNSGVSIAAARIYNYAHVVMITGASSNPELTRLGFPYVYRLATNDNVMGRRMADYSANVLKLKRAAVVDDRTESQPNDASDSRHEIPIARPVDDVRANGGRPDSPIRVRPEYQLL